MPKALVTGSAGFVGSSFCTALASEGWQVTELDTANSQAEDVRIFFPLSGEYYDLVVHCAAVVGGRLTIEGAPLALASNLEIDSAMFQWAARTRPGRVVYFSSSAAYPVRLQDRMREKRLAEPDIDLADPRMPDQLYGWAKLTGEMLAQRARGEGVAVTVVRPFSGYGEEQDDCYPFPAFIDRALRREDPFTIWGTGRQVRDFIHIDDIVAATLHLVEKEENGPVNLCSGRGTSMLSLAQQVCEAAGYEPEFETVPTAPQGVVYRVGDPIKFLKHYAPKVSLAEGIHRALDWRKQRA